MDDLATPDPPDTSADSAPTGTVGPARGQPFKVHAPFSPAGDQPKAIDELADGIDAPSLFVSGGQDATSTGAARDRIKAAMPGIRTAEIAHSGHVIYMEAADELNILLGEFFDSQGDTP